NRTSVNAASRVDARHQAEVRAWWRDWQRYLQAHTQLLDTRASETTGAPSFERTDEAWEAQRIEAELTLRRIPHDRRVVFDQQREDRRVAVEAGLEATVPATDGMRSAGLDP